MVIRFIVAYETYVRRIGELLKELYDCEYSIYVARIEGTNVYVALGSIDFKTTVNRSTIEEYITQHNGIVVL